MFGAMLLFPLYYQVVRGQSALDAGLLMAPQRPRRGGDDADIGPHRRQRRGRQGRPLRPAAVSRWATLTYTQLGADTSYALLAGSLFVAGLRHRRDDDAGDVGRLPDAQPRPGARATTTLNILMRVGGSIGTALFAVVLAAPDQRQRLRRHRRWRRRGRPRRDRRDPRGRPRQGRPRASPTPSPTPSGGRSRCCWSR